MRAGGRPEALGPELSGLLLVDKESGPTSHDLVDRLRRVAGQRSVGHVGTLDPMATGLMGLLLGPATKLAPYLSSLGKLYEAEAVLGLSTDTLDAAGRVLTAHPGPYPGREAVAAALAAMTGEVLQVPPAYSAVKVGGVASHRAARAGRPLDLAPRRVSAEALELLDYRPPVARIRARVSTGYYVRALARDLGLALGLGGGSLAALRRLAVGPFSVAEAAPAPASREELAQRLLSPRRALPHLPEISLSEAAAKRLGSGACLPSPDLPAGGPYKIIGPGGLLVALAEIAPPPEGEGPTPPRRPFLRPLRVLGPFGGPSPSALKGEH